MTRKRILNITSTKKQDNRLQTDFSAGQLRPANQYVVGNGTPFSAIYCPTAMTPLSPTTVPAPNYPENSSYRERSTIFLRGYKETVRITPEDGACWLWRRIVFFSKEVVTTNSADGLYHEAAPLGYTRPFVAATAATSSLLQDLVFKGRVGRDWFSVGVAKVDTTRITLVSDVTRTLKGGNEQAHTHNNKLWYGVNKNLVYYDDESGIDIESSHFSTSAKPGCGNMYIWDILATPGLAPGPDNQPTARAAVTLHGTLYWHEK